MAALATWAGLGIGRLMDARKPRAILWDDGAWWPDAPLSGSAHYVSPELPDPPPVILVPDGKGDYREHHVSSRPQGRLGF